MDIIDPFKVLEKTSKSPVRWSVPWALQDFVDRDLLRRVLDGFEAAGLPHTHFFVAMNEMRLPLYDDLSREPVGWCGQPMALGIRYVQWRLMDRTCAFFNVSFPGTGQPPPPSGQGPPDLAYTKNFIDLTARQAHRNRTLEQNIQQKLQALDVEEKNRTAEEAKKPAKTKRSKQATKSKKNRKPDENKKSDESKKPDENKSKGKKKRTANDADMDLEMAAPASKKQERKLTSPKKKAQKISASKIKKEGKSAQEPRSLRSLGRRRSIKVEPRDD